jgi:hypothetical protein
MTIRTFIAGVALAAGLAIGASAEAAVQVVAVNGANAAATFDDALAVGDAGIISGSRIGTGGFTHSVFFDVSSGTGGGVTATPNNLTIGTIEFFGISGLSYQVFDAVTATAITGVQAASSLLTFAAAAGGSYYVTFTGTATGIAGGNYAANIAITPIPAAILLLAPAVAGLGLVAYRRRTRA